MDISIFILAGGKSSRMMQDKGLMLFREKPLVKHIVDTLSSSKSKTNIIANNDGYKSFGLSVFEDKIKDKGPIGGLYTALTHSNTSHVLLVSCDMPMITIASINKLLNSVQDNYISIASIDGRLNPLLAVYPTNIKDFVVEKIAKDQLKMISLVESLPHKIVNFDKKTDDSRAEFVNFNTPEDISNFEQYGK